MVLRETDTRRRRCDLLSRERDSQSLSLEFSKGKHPTLSLSRRTKEWDAGRRAHERSALGVFCERKKRVRFFSHSSLQRATRRLSKTGFERRIVVRATQSVPSAGSLSQRVGTYSKVSKGPLERDTERRPNIRTRGCWSRKRSKSHLFFFPFCS